MYKKIISAALVGALCAGTLVSCGDKEKSSSKDGLSTKGTSEYVRMIPVDVNISPFRNGIDNGIKYSIEMAKDCENDDGYNPFLIKFSNDKFVMARDFMPDHSTFYDGSFTVDDGKINFSYENFISWDSGGDINKIGIDDEYEELDEDVLMGTSDKLNGLSEEEQKAMRNEEAAKASIANIIKQMQTMNETGSYCRLLIPSMNASVKYTDYSILPYIRWTARPTDVNWDLSNTMKAAGDFLCADTYGIELEGDYKKGKDFTLKHDLEETIKEDEQSLYQFEEDKEEYLETQKERATHFYNCGSLETTIEFSDGEWEWYNNAGELLNNGKYEESKDHPGLIMMTLDEDSLNAPEYALAIMPLWFYIADDGEIYYPAYVKLN